MDSCDNFSLINMRLTFIIDFDKKPTLYTVREPFVGTRFVGTLRNFSYLLW
jgi:hypothetical protein